MKQHHTESRAHEIEFYIPAAAWEAPATKRLLDSLLSLGEGATVVGGATGVWHGQTETTHLVRVIVPTAPHNREQPLQRIHRAAHEMIASWSENPSTHQDTFLFVQREVTAHTIRPHKTQ